LEQTDQEDHNWGPTWAKKKTKQNKGPMPNTTKAKRVGGLAHNRAPAWQAKGQVQTPVLQKKKKTYSL
jgi:hypothetical protein